MFRSFEAFLIKVASRLRGIAHATKNGGTAKDMHGDVWIAANELGEKRGSDLDFSDADDQELILARVYSLSRRCRDGRLSSAVQIDQYNSGDEKAINWAERLPAHIDSDPVEFLLRREEALEGEAKLAASYSQATAYVRTFARFKHDQEKVCEHLLISKPTLVKRIDLAAKTLQVQPSLFDGISKIGKRFIPLPGKPYEARPECKFTAAQGVLDF